MNTIKLFGHRPGTGLRKAPSYKVDRTYAEALKDAHNGLTGFPQLQELDNKISALERSLRRTPTCRALASHWPIDIRVPESAIQTTEGYAEELAFTPPSDAPRQLIPSLRNATDSCQGEPSLQEIL